MSLIIHHLNNSRSQRILWLMEELGLDYEIRHYQRDAVTSLAPPELLAVHPLGKSPVLEDNGRVIIESAAITDYLCEHHGGQALVPARGTDDYLTHTELMHFAEGSAMTPLLLGLYVRRLGDAGAPLLPRIGQQMESHFDFMEAQLRPSGHFVLDQLSAVDVMLSMVAEFALGAGMTRTRPKLGAFVEWVHARPAWASALERGGEYRLL